MILKKGHTLEEDFEIEEDAVALDGVVVSANRNETTRRLAPTLVNVVDLKIFENTNSTTLAQGLNFQPGVRVESNCQNCGFQQVRINGLDGPYTQILLDSRPIFSALSGVYGIEQIPASMIERVEVMRGGGSALFGSSAIAGTINIITKEPIRNSGMLSHTITGIGDGDAFDNSTALNASLVTDDQRAGLYIFGQNRHRSAYDHDGDGYSEIPKIHGQTVGFRSFLKTTTYSKLTFEYHHMEEFRRGGDMLNRPPHEANVAEQTEHSINGGGMKFDYFSPDEKHRFNVFASAQHINRDSYYGGGQDPNAYGNTTDLNWMAGSQYVYSFGKCIFMPSDFTAGVEFNQDKLEDNMWGYNRTVDQKVNIGSAFVQNEWKNDRWGFLLGGRFDKHNLIDHLIFSPRANLRFNPTKDINLRLSYSSGFRAPQAFDEDLHVENVGGKVAMIELADNLKTHLLRYPVDLLEQRKIEKVELAGKDKLVTTSVGEKFIAPALIIATGASWRKLNVPGENDYIGRGVAFCPHCDGPFYKGKHVAVVGGGNSGIEAAIDLAGICSKVTVFEFMDELKADNVLQERLKTLPNVEVFVSSQTTEVVGNGDKLTALRIKDRKTEEERLVELDGVFVQIGLSANSSAFREVVETNRPGEIVIDAHCRTNVTGIYAAGDVSTVPYKQIIISMGEGAKAALSAFDDRVRGVI